MRGLGIAKSLLEFPEITAIIFYRANGVLWLIPSLGRGDHAQRCTEKVFN